MKRSTERLLWIGGGAAVLVGGIAALAFGKSTTPSPNPQPNPNPAPKPNPTPNPGPTPHPNPDPNPNPHPTFCEVNFVTSVDGPYSGTVCLDGTFSIRAALDWAVYAMGDPKILAFENVTGGMFNWKTVGRGTTTIRLHNQKTDIYQDFTITVP